MNLARYFAFLAVILANVAVSHGQFGGIANPRASKPPAVATLHRFPVALRGHPISTKLADPFMSSDQIDQIKTFLDQRYQFAWDGSTTPRDIQRDLARYLPVEIDFVGLDEIGLSADTPVYPDKQTARTRSTPKRPAVSAPDIEIDPDPFSDDSPFDNDSVFGDAIPEVSATGPSEDAPAAEHPVAASQRWWRTDSPANDDRLSVSNGSKLIHFLDGSDLTLNVRLGQLQITTLERAEQFCSVYLFDVTALVPVAESRGLGSSGRVFRSNVYDYQSLIDLVQTSIDPDTWEVLGGPSTIAPFTTHNRRWLVVSAPLLVQWKINALFTRLTD